MKNSLMRFLKVSCLLLCVFSCGRMQSFAALQYQEIYTSTAGTNKILIVVNSAIYAAVYDPSIKQYVSDLEAEDYSVKLVKFIGGSAADLKGYIKSLDGLKGIVFIGDLPVPEFEIANDFGIYGYARFPIDLFYMDLDGEWLDTDANGVYDTHNAGGGTLTPEIWLSRLTASTVLNSAMDEAAQLKNYFAKNHSYRLGKLQINKRALAYPDDDWYYFNDCSLKNAYSDVVIINDKSNTVSTDYKARLKENFEWIHVCVHSNPSLHAFYNSGSSGGYVFNTDVRSIDPTALFYNLFACSNCKYNAANYMGGNYVFAKTFGLAAVGSTKTGSMLSFYNFYTPLGAASRKTLGEAFKDWFKLQNLDSLCNRGWFYGMTLLGDATLSLDPPVATVVSINPANALSGASIAFAGTGKISTGSITAYNWKSSKDGYLSYQSSFTTNKLSIGTHTIFFKAKDSKGRWSSEAQATVVITDPNEAKIPVTVQNQPPILQNIGNKTGYLKKNLSFYVKATDPNRDSISYAAYNLPSGAQFVTTTGYFSWKPSKKGIFKVTFQAVDKPGAKSAPLTINITIK